MNKRIGSSTLLVVLSFLILFSRSTSAESLAGVSNIKLKAPLKIGVSLGITGAAQQSSKYIKDGLDLATEEINAAGGIDGQKLELVYEDSQSDPKQSVTGYRKLVDVDRVKAVIASTWSILTNPIIPLTRKDKIIVISPTVMDASVESSSDYFFTMGHKIETVRHPTERFFETHPEIKTIAVICWDDAWGRANLKVWQEVATAKQIRIVDTLYQGNYSADYRSEISRIAAKRPDAVFVAYLAERAARRMRELKLNSIIYTTNVILEALGAPGMDDTLLEDVYFTYWPQQQEFVDAFKKRFSYEPPIEALNSYETIRSLAKAFELSPAEPLTGLRQVHYQGVSGPIDFRTSPFVNDGPGKLMLIKNGKATAVE